MTEEEAKLYKACKKKQEEELKKAAMATGFPGGAGARRRDRGYTPYPSQQNWSWYQPGQMGQQWPAVANQQSGPGQADLSAAAGAPAASQLAIQYGGQQGPQAFGGASQRQRYPCKACGMLGHWMRDGLCKPEDVALEMARKYALFSSGRGPSGMNSTISCHWSTYFHFVVIVWVD